MKSKNAYLNNKIKNLGFFTSLMIVYLHSYNLPTNFEKNYIYFIENFITDGITRVAVPFFFVLSGFLFFYNFKLSIKTYLSKLKKRIISILIPYLLWSLFSITLVLLFSLINIEIGNFSISTIYDFIYYLFIKPIPFQLWFLRDLFIMAILSPLIYWAVKKGGFILLLTLFVIWFYNYQIFIVIDNETALFFILGAYMSLNNSEKITLKKLHGKYLLIIFILWIITIILKLEDAFFIRKLFMHKLSELFGLFFIWFFYDYIYDKIRKRFNYEKILWIRDFSFFVFLLHEPLLSLIKKSTLHLFNNELFLLISYFVYPTLVIILSLFMGKFLKEYFKYYKTLTGGR